VVLFSRKLSNYGTVRFIAFFGFATASGIEGFFLYGGAGNSSWDWLRERVVSLYKVCLGWGSNSPVYVGYYWVYVVGCYWYYS
jgi:hypothetical protein